MSELRLRQSRYRRASIQIDTAALAHNLGRVRDFAGDSRVMAVIKADAYGHGVITAAKALHDADLFGVAMTAEALELRAAGVEKNIVVLHGFSSIDELADYSRHALTTVIHSPQQAEILCNARLDRPLDVWLKLDTGMHRLGLYDTELQALYPRLQDSANVGHITLMSHMANADDKDNDLNNKQIRCISKVKSEFNLPASLANSAAIMQLSSAHFDIVRPGIMLYGSSPFTDVSAEQLDLKPVMQFEADVIAIKQVEAGESIGYGSTYTCEHDTRVAMVAAGYADGYPRHAANGTPVWLNGQRCRLLGRVSMDSICIEIDELQAAAGDRAVLWGRELSVDEVARHSGTISYELLCHAGAAGRS